MREKFGKWLSEKQIKGISVSVVLEAYDEVSSFIVSRKIHKLGLWAIQTQKEFKYVRTTLLGNKFFRAIHKYACEIFEKTWKLFDEFLVLNMQSEVKTPVVNSEQETKTKTEVPTALYKELFEIFRKNPDKLYTFFGIGSQLKGVYGRANVQIALDSSEWIEKVDDKYRYKSTTVTIKREEVKDEEYYKQKYPLLYQKLYVISKVFDDAQGVSLDRIFANIGPNCDKELVVEILKSTSWVVIKNDKCYFNAGNIDDIEIDAKDEKSEADDFDKEKYVSVLMNRFRNGMTFDSIDIEIFKDTYSDLYDEKIELSDDELISRLKKCGVYYQDRLFPAEGIIDSETNTKLFNYIEEQFSSGKKVLYYKAIYTELTDVFVYCFSLTDEMMLREYIKFSAEKGKYYFFENYMSTEENVEINHSQEIENYMLSIGKPASYEEIYNGLSHIAKDIIYKEIRSNSNYVMNEKEHYFHIDLFEFSEIDEAKVSVIIQNILAEDGYAIWSDVYFFIQQIAPSILENNPYLSSLGLRNAISYYIKDRYNFDGAVICSAGTRLGMADVYKLYAQKNTPFTDDDIYNFSAKVDSPIYFDALGDVCVRVSRNKFVAKDQIKLDIREVDRALETYLTDGYILIKDVDSFLVFPNVEYEWNEFLLESFLHYYSRKFCLINNGTSLNNVAGAVTLRDGEYTQFVDICANELAKSDIELTKTPALNYLADINLITRRSYKDIDVALNKARQIRNMKG